VYSGSQAVMAKLRSGDRHQFRGDDVHGKPISSAHKLKCRVLQMVMGFGSAAAILIRGYLGAGEPQRAKQAT
jgi:hypothetical protein